MAELDALDRRLQARTAFSTLEPGRSRARLPSEICERIVQPGPSAAFVSAFTRGFADAVEAMRAAFPDNLLWDVEALAARQWSQALATDDPVGTVRASWSRIAELQHVFGARGPIRFRYIHDFIYGFDWARWVAEEPDTRASVGPYDAAFVERMHQRGQELLELIDAGDAKYGPLPDEKPRNPFGFSREPADELALHRRLASEGSLPVQAWSGDVAPDWTRPYAKLREEAAEALRISA